MSPFKAYLAEYLAYQARAPANAKVDVPLNTEVTAEFAGLIAPDVIIVALGVRPIKPPIQEIERHHGFSAEEMYLDPAKAGKSVILLGGLVGTELGIYLASLERKVTILEMLDALNFAVMICKSSRFAGKLKGRASVSVFRAKRWRSMTGEWSEQDRKASSFLQPTGDLCRRPKTAPGRSRSAAFLGF